MQQITTQAGQKTRNASGAWLWAYIFIIIMTVFFPRSKAEGDGAIADTA